MGDGNQDRLLLHHPMCMTFPDHPNCEESCQQTFTSFSGKIEIKDYESYTSCLWQIKLPPTRTIEIQFTGDFDLEYHYQCGYDRVHIFSGSIDGDNQRQGRFCGPKGTLSLFLLLTKFDQDLMNSHGMVPSVMSLPMER